MKKSNLLINILLIAGILLYGCNKAEESNINIHYYDAITKQPLSGIPIDVVQDPGSSDSRDLTHGQTDKNGLFSFGSSVDEESQHLVVAFFFPESDPSTLSYQYSQNGCATNSHTNNYNVFLEPAGNLYFATSSYFWQSKNYDTLVIKYSIGEDTLIKNIKPDLFCYGYLNTKYSFVFYSVKNNLENAVYSLDTILPNGDNTEYDLKF